MVLSRYPSWDRAGSPSAGWATLWSSASTSLPRLAHPKRDRVRDLDHVGSRLPVHDFLTVGTTAALAFLAFAFAFASRAGISRRASRRVNGGGEREGTVSLRGQAKYSTRQRKVCFGKGPGTGGAFALIAIKAAAASSAVRFKVARPTDFSMDAADQSHGKKSAGAWAERAT